MSLASSLKVLTSHLVVALIALVVIGGATRVMEAGLACPDWPLCYGVLLPGRQMNAQVFLEWFHRLDAFLVGLALLALLGASVWLRRQLPAWCPWLALLAVILVALQGALGALTVTRLLAAPMVTAHLATALLLLWLISGIDQGLVGEDPSPQLPIWRVLLPLVPTALVLAQCALGGAMASQWAVDHCFRSGSQCEWVFRHRQLALPAALAVFAVAGLTLFSPLLDRLSRGLASTAAGLVGVQVLLGVLTLKAQLQRPYLTIAHQLVAALLVATLGALSGRFLRGGFRRSSPSSLEVSCG
ncbi:MAG: COX15/CtaA family protein [Cyanobacteriota bacterium]|nr:COX15/CtaA family protein [Cyanobacteriota bacterium]